jgi:hypothetical protein
MHQGFFIGFFSPQSRPDEIGIAFHRAGRGHGEIIILESLKK